MNLKWYQAFIYVFLVLFAHKTCCFTNNIVEKRLDRDATVREFI